jgi:hypothetical protein
MGFSFESLESRRLFSNMAITTLHSDEMNLREDNYTIRAMGVGNAIIIGYEIFSNDELPASAHDLAVVNRDYKLNCIVLTNRISAEIAKINLDVVGLNATENLLILYPSNARLLARAAAQETKLTDDSSTAQTDIDDDSTTLQTDVDNDLNALGTLDSSDSVLQTDISTAETSLSTAVSDLQSQANGLFTTDTAAVIASF